MSKLIKQMEMDALKAAFRDVRDLVVLSIKGLNATVDNQLRHRLRGKNIRLLHVKNSLTRRVFGELGLNIGADSPYWQGPSVMAFGAGSLADLSRELKGELEGPKTAAQYKGKVTIKGAVSDGQAVTFDAAL